VNQKTKVSAQMEGVLLEFLSEDYGGAFRRGRTHRRLGMGGLSAEGRTHEFLNTLEGGFEPGLTSCRVGRMPTKLRVHSLMYGRCGGSLCNFILEGPVPWRKGAAFAKDWPNWRLVGSRRGDSGRLRAREQLAAGMEQAEAQRNITAHRRPIRPRERCHRRREQDGAATKRDRVRSDN
jgi:hypothetical protein